MEARSVDAPVQRVQRVERMGALGVSRGFIGKAVEQHRRTVEVAQVHLRQHLLRNPAVHGDGEGLWSEVIERNLFPQPKAEPVREQGKHLVRWMVIDTHEVGMYAHRSHEKCLNVSR